MTYLREEPGMAKIVISTNASLDGVTQDPDGLENHRAGGWFTASLGTDQAAWAGYFTADAMEASALLLGRRSEEWFAARWAARTGEWADRLNGMPKYVVSATAAAPAWSNSTILAGDVVTEVARLKQETEGDIFVYASYRLVHALIEHDLADELRLVIFPVLAGDGDRLFGPASASKPLRLLRAEPLGAGLALLYYEIGRTA
jgi:dihydrofolate reductase